MKLDELRERLRAPSRYHDAVSPGRARKKGKRRRKRARKTGFGVALFVDFEDGDERIECIKCGKRFVADPRRPYTGRSLCGDCDPCLTT